MKNHAHYLRLLCITAGVLPAVVFTSDLSAQSLWDRRVPQTTNAISSVRAYRPGDIVFVSIAERTAVDNRDTRLMNKQNLATANAGGGFSLSGLLGTGEAGLETENDSDSLRSVNANTQYRSARDFLDRVALTVMDVDQNGNLLVSGERFINLEGDQRRLVVSGVVRAVDIENNNTINSRSAANLRIHYESDGSETNFINQGWLGKKLNRWLPF